MAKKETHIPAIIDTPEALEAKIAAMKEAQKNFCYLYSGAGRQDLQSSRNSSRQSPYSACKSP